jgi:hypothetical protein
MVCKMVQIPSHYFFSLLKTNGVLVFFFFFPYCKSFPTLFFLIIGKKKKSVFSLISVFFSPLGGEVDNFFF